MSSSNIIAIHAGGDGPGATTGPAPSFGGLIVYIVGCEALSFALNAQVWWTQATYAGLVLLKPLVYGLALLFLAQGSLWSASLLLLGFWIARCRWPFGGGDPATTAATIAAAAAEAEAMSPSDVVAAYHRARHIKIGQTSVTALLLLVAWVCGSSSATVIAFLMVSITVHAGVLLMRSIIDPVAAMQAGSVRARVLLILIGQEHRLPQLFAHIIGSEMGPRWGALWFSVRVEADVARHVYLTALKAIIERWIAASVAALFVNAPRLHAINATLAEIEQEEAFRMARARAARAARRIIRFDEEEEEEEEEEYAAAYVTPTKEEIVAWLVAHGARVADQWWGNDDGELCTICLSALSGPPSGVQQVSGATTPPSPQLLLSVASFPCDKGDAVQQHHRHVYHTNCICDWLCRKTGEPTCPLCRATATPLA